MWYVYILLCAGSSLYTGYSNDVDQRFSDHKNGKGGHYTRSHKPVKLIYKEQFETQSEALKRERQINYNSTHMLENMQEFSLMSPKEMLIWNAPNDFSTRVRTIQRMADLHLNSRDL